MKFCSMIGTAFKDKNFVNLLVSFTALDAVFIAIGVVLDPFFEALGFSSTEVSILGVTVVLSGVISSLVVGALLDKYRKYLLIYRVVCFGSMLVWLACFGIFLTKNIWIVGATAIFIGGFLVPFLPVGTSFAGEITFPMQEAIIIGLL